GSEDAVGTMANFERDSLVLTAMNPDAHDIWNPDQNPAVDNSASKIATEVGVRFQATAAGYITGIRFYKGMGNTGTDIGSMWSADGTRLATATFTNET